MKGKIFAIATLMLVQPCMAQDARPSSADQRYENLKTAINIGEFTVSPSIDDDRINQAMASLGWIEGVYDVLQMNAAAKYPMAICPPSGLSRISLARIYTNYMDANPNTHGLADISVATISALKAFPCGASTPSP